MSGIDTEGLVIALAEGSPCGDDIESDPSYFEMQSIAEGTPEQQFGDTIIAAEPPDWRKLRDHCLEMFKRTRHLRVAVQLTRALIALEGYEGLRDGLAVIRNLCEKRWEAVHPQLLAEDDHDPTERLNILLTLADRSAVLQLIREATLVTEPQLGAYSLRDIHIARGDASLPEGSDRTPPTTAQIDTAFLQCELADLERTLTAIQTCISHTKALVSCLQTKGESLDLGDLMRTLDEAEAALKDPIAKRKGEGIGGHEEESGGDGPATPQQVRTREDVIQLLDRACRYFESHEPSSPVPLLLKRAKRLIAKDFLEILGDLAPDGLNEARKVAGVDKES